VGVLEDFGVDAGGVALTEMESHLDFAVDGVGLLDAAAEEADHDGGGDGWWWRQHLLDEGVEFYGGCRYELRSDEGGDGRRCGG
jgi:hypothetical protein